jgi:hypothetical protein
MDFDEWSLEGGATMSPDTEKDFDKYARECVRLADQADTPELREQLLTMARDWMRAVMDEEDAHKTARGRRQEKYDGQADCAG